MTLRAIGSVPPTVFDGSPNATPVVLPSGFVPPASVPMRLPMTAVVLTLLEPVPIWMPVPLPEMTLPGGIPGVEVSPPICVAEAAKSTSTPVLPPSATVPVTSVPMKLPCIRVRAAMDSWMPGLPSIILRACAVVPPIRASSLCCTITPWPLATAAVPFRSVPIKFPCTT